MKNLENFENKKGNKLIFRQRTSDIPSLGSSVLVEKPSNSREKKYSEIGKIIDVFGPVKEPWVVVNLFKDKDLDYTNFSFYWRKQEQFKKKFSRDKGFRKKRDFKKKKAN